MMTTINVHGTGPTDSFSARSTERQRRIYLILYLHECVQEHRTASLHVNIVGHVLRPVCGVIGIGSIDVKPLHSGFLFRGESLVEL